MKSPKKNGIGEVVTEYGARVMKVIKKGLLGRSLFDFYGDIKAQAFKTIELSSVPSTPADGKGGVIYTKSSDGKLYYKSNEVSEVELSSSGATLTTEEVQDIVGAMFSSNTETNITVTYQDADGTIDLVATDTNTQLTTEEVQDIVGAMVDGGTETNISVTYDDTSGKLNFASTDTNTTYSEATSSSEGLMSTAHHDKLDGIETSADVTDATNVTAAGALMDSELTDLAGIKSLNTSTLVNLSGTQTITGTKTFERNVILDGDKSVTAGSDGVTLHVDAQDITDTSTSGSGTAASFNHVVVENPRLMATNSSVTTTNASTVYIKGAPAASTNQTITNAYALYVAAGFSYFGGDIIAGNDTIKDSGNNTIISSNGSGVVTMAGGNIAIGGSNANLNMNSGSDIILEADNNGGGNTSTIQYPDSGGTNRIILGADSDVAILSNRASNGTVQIRANTSTAGGSGEVTVVTVEDDKVTISQDLDVTGNVLPGITYVKILPSDFMPDDAGRPAMIDDTSSDRWLESHGTAKLFAYVDIPVGFKATHVDIYGSATSAVTVYEADVNSKTVTSKGTGNIGTQINITDVNSDATNYILIELAQASGEEVYGGKLTIAKI